MWMQQVIDGSIRSSIDQPMQTGGLFRSSDDCDLVRQDGVNLGVRVRGDAVECRVSEAGR